MSERVEHHRPWRLGHAVARYRDHRQQSTHLTIDAFQVSSGLLLLALVVHPPGETPLVARLVFALGLVLPMVSRRFATFWFVALVLFVASPLERAWLTLDNHEVLQVYWLAAFALSRFADRPMAVLRSTARWTLALVFVFATLWKLLAPDFVDGSAIEFFFGVEQRVGDVAVAAGLQPEGRVKHNWEQLEQWLDATATPEDIDNDVTPLLQQVSVGLAWATIVLEAAVAVVFLLPLRAHRRWVRDATLIAFVLLTYPIAPVLPFAWLLLSMGAMQSELPEKRLRRAYVVTFFVVTFVYGLRQWTILPGLEFLSGVG